KADASFRLSTASSVATCQSTLHFKCEQPRGQHTPWRLPRPLPEYGRTTRARGKADYPSRADGSTHAGHSVGKSRQEAVPHDCGAPDQTSTSSSQQAGKQRSRKSQFPNEEKLPVVGHGARYSRWLPGSSPSAE